MTINMEAPSFEPFGEELNVEVALLQAANVLDLAVYVAVQSNSVEKLLDASAMWMGLAERLANGYSQDEDDEEFVEKPNKQKFGFCNVTSESISEPDESVIVEDDNDEEENEDA